MDNRHYVRCLLEESAMEQWRKHACLPRLSMTRRQACYAAAVPFIIHIARILVDCHAWLVLQHSSEHIFRIHPPSNPDAPDFFLPQTFLALFRTPRLYERMFEATFAGRVDIMTNKIQFTEPLGDLFHLFQLLTPGCFLIVDAQYLSHDVDDEGEIALIRWHTSSCALPSPQWMDYQAAFSPALVDIFGHEQWVALRRAAADSPSLVSDDITFS